MDSASFVRLFSLAAIWGGSFLFMRIGAPVLGAAWLVEWRVGLAALFLALVGWHLRKRLQAAAHWRHYLVLGLFNSALPFLLFSYAAQTLSASLLSILNATAPIWGAVIVALWTRSPLAAKTLTGLLLGIVGVALLVGFDSVAWRPGAPLAICAALGAAFCYGIASTYARTARTVDAFSNAHGSMWAATLLLLPVVPFFPMSGTPDGSVIASVVALGILCSGIAYLLYFRLIQDLGAPSALTVTFLIPMFGVFWGHLFLDEVVGWYTLAGSLVVIVGTALVTGFSPRQLFLSKVGQHA
ncbi:DMT family transporter [Sedimenticola sp.]|uniref:DMT family transporter n=1 Tax=Sedimenticola sp. TaxID=1940285 RepID=UPI003D0C7DA8